MTDTNNTQEASQTETPEVKTEATPTIPEVGFVDRVRTKMISTGLKEKLEIFDSDSDIVLACKVADKAQQRDLVNRFFNTQLCTKGTDSIEERFVLIDTDTDDMWLKLFEDKVVPYLLENDLPVELETKKKS